MRQQILIAFFLVIPVMTHAGEIATLLRGDHAVVSYSGITQEYAEAIAATVEAARVVAVGQFGFNMPETITLVVRKNRRERVRLFNDGQNRFSLTVRSEKDLRKPATSGIFHIYGLCHEVGHLGMYRLIHDHSWMTTTAAEGWAHYIGSRIVDEVHARKGESLWPDRYDYLVDGTKRLNAQLSGKNPRPITKGAAAWKELVEIVGDRGIASIFAAWGKAKIDPTDPGAALRKALLATSKDKRLGRWWNKAEPIMVFKRPKRGFAARKAKRAELTGQAIELSHDDGTAVVMNSLAGGEHGVRFKVLGDSWYLTSVRINGSRYGHPNPPRENFHVWLCNKDSEIIADFPFPYAKFARGGPNWVTLMTPPTNVPQDFIISVGFNPTGKKGIFVSRDRHGSGDSLTGLLGRVTKTFNKGDWLIRAAVDQLKIANSLEPRSTAVRTE